MHPFRYISYARLHVCHTNSLKTTPENELILSSCLYDLPVQDFLLILHKLVTGWVQSAYYAIWIRAGEPKPQPGSRQWVIHRKRIQILVILAYLIYTIYEADWQLRGARDFYQDLGVPHNVDERGLQSRFRRL